MNDQTTAADAPSSAATPANAAIFFAGDAYDSGGAKLMGRNVAGEGFLRGFLEHARGLERLYCYGPHANTETGFRSFCAGVGSANASLPIQWARDLGSPQLAEAGVLFTPGPGLGDFAWQRRRGDQRAFSLCGVTHTISSERAMDGIGAWATAPVQDWDAVICTSRAVADSVETLRESQFEYLRERFGATHLPKLQMPVIPLGVDCSAFDPTRPGASEAGAALRRKLAIPEEAVVVLYVGRFSFHAKAHPQAMYVALEEAARQTSTPVHLVQAGWFPNDGIADAFHTGAKTLAPSVTHHFIDGRQPDVRKHVWFAADIFCSLSDNIQETFGITPIEAMAAGLPVVVSDWDGYRDTVVPEAGQDVGFRAPTWNPPPGSGVLLADAFGAETVTYDRYCGHACLASAVEIGATRDAFTALIADPTLRRRMGDAGRRRARRLYDWSVVIAAYQELWAELNARRRHAAESAPRPSAGTAWPLRPDPFTLFAHYATHTLGPETPIRRAQRLSGDYVRLCGSLTMNTFAQEVAGPTRAAQVLFDALPRDGTAVTLGAALASSPETRGEAGWRAAGWLLKTGLIDVDRAV